MASFRDRKLYSQAKKSNLAQFYQQNKYFLWFLLTLFFIRSTFINWNYIPSGSMNPNLIEGDLALVNKLAYDIKIPFWGKNLIGISNPQRGEIVVFDNNNKLFVKRILAIPGDIVQIKENNFYVNRKKLPLKPTTNQLVENKKLPSSNKYSFNTFQESNFLHSKNHHSYTVIFAKDLPSRIHSNLVTDNIEFEIAQGHYFMIGDNRNLSHDSRYFGSVQRDKIVGKVNTVLFNYQQLWHAQTQHKTIDEHRFSNKS
jgi:signal peptidase I